MVKIYKCPGCNADMKFDANAQMLKCEYCETELTVKAAEELEEAAKQDAEHEDTDETVDETDESASYGAEEVDFIKYKCVTCGAELLTDEHTAATVCSYCGNPNLLSERIEGEKTPAMLIPFKVDKAKATEIYRNWCKKGPLTPGEFSSQSTIDKLSAIYVPFWLYDYDANAKIRANCTKVRRRRTGNYEYIYTDHFRVYRDVSAEYIKLPADASAKMPDDIMDKLEPFNYKDLEEFSMPYLSGYTAEKYNFTNEELAGRVESRVKNYIVQEGRGTINMYASVNVVGCDVKLSKKSAKYVMLPVWMLNYRYKGKEHVFAINGQTGKLVGKRPISVARCVIAYFLMMAAIFVVCLIGGAILF